jgi:hypothetical protein
MSEEIKNNVEQAATTATESAPVKETNTTAPYKVYGSEDEFKKDFQSVASKAKYEVLKELNVKSLDEVKSKIIELEAAKNELVEASKIKSEYEQVKLQKQQVEENLLLTQLGVVPELKDDFLVLAKAKVTPELPLAEAAKTVIEKYKYFKGESTITDAAVKIGLEKKANGKAELENELAEKIRKSFGLPSTTQKKEGK